MAIRIAVLVGGLLGALLLLAAEGTTLYAVYTAGGTAPVQSVNTGSHQGYALVPIALLAALLPRMGIVGAALASLLAYVGISAIQITLLYSASGLPPLTLVRTPLKLRELIARDPPR